MTKNEMIKEVRKYLHEQWNRGVGMCAIDTAEGVVALFPDDTFDYEWQPQDENTPVDTPVFARDSVGQMWKKLYSSSLGKCWDIGRGSWSTSIDNYWEMIVLADTNNPNRVPPADFVLGGKNDAQ